MGVDKFLIVLPHTNIEQANSLIENLQTVISELTYSFDKTLKISCNFSSYEYKNSDSLNDMLKNVHRSIYKAKIH